MFREASRRSADSAKSHKQEVVGSLGISKHIDVYSCSGGACLGIYYPTSIGVYAACFGTYSQAPIGQAAAFAHQGHGCENHM